jgi:hypothetical protein
MRRDWGPWTLVGGVLLVAVAAIARGALRRLRNRA